MASEFLENLLQETLQKQKERLDIPAQRLDIPAPGSPITQRGMPYVSLPDLPGWLETFAGNFSEQNEVLAGLRFLGRVHQSLSDSQRADEIIPEGWEPFTEDAIAGTTKNFWDYILDSKTPKEQAMRRQEVLELMEGKERLANGSFFAAMAGGVAGAILSPTTVISMLLPSIAAAKFIPNIVRFIPRVALDSLAHEIIVQLGKEKGSGTLEKAVLDAAVDTVFVTGLYGGVKALGVFDKSAAIWHSRSVVNKTYEGIDVKYKVNEKTGAFEGLLATAAEGQSVGADALSLAQKFLDEGMVQYGLAGTFIKKINNNIFGSPLIKGLTSPFANVKQFYNRLVNESIETGATKKGVPRKSTATEILRIFENRGRQVGQMIHDLYLEHLGIKPGITGDAMAVIRQFKEGLTSTKTAFNNDIATVVYSGVESASRHVNEAAKVVTEHLGAIWKAFLDAYNLPPDILPPRTAYGYLMRIYNLEEMVSDPKRFIDMVVDTFTKQDARIAEINEPLNALKEQLVGLNLALKSAEKSAGKQINSSIRSVRKQIKREKASLIKRMQDGDIDPILLDRRVMLNSAELNELSSLLSPLKKLKDKIGSAKEELSGLTKNEQKASRAKIRKLEAEAAKIEADLSRKAKSGTINPKFFTRTKEGWINLRKPEEEIPFFRKPYEDADAMAKSAQQSYDLITNSTPEQINQNILESLVPGVVGRPSPTLTRTLLVPDMTLLDNNFMLPDVGKMVTSYTRSLGKRIALKKTLESMGHEDMEAFSNSLKMEYDIKRNAILYKLETDSAGNEISTPRPRTKARDKALKKLSNQLNTAEEQVGDLHSFFMGTHIKSDGLAKFSKGMKNLTSMTMLGKIALYQVGEIGGIIFKQGLFTPIAVTMRRFLPGLSRAAKSKFAKENASHALVGLENSLSKMSQAMYETGSVASIPGAWFSNFIQKGADLAPVFSGINFVTNLQQRLSADMTQSRVMTSMFKASEGRLSKVEAKRLIMNGIDPKDYKKWISEYEKAGGYSSYGGHYSNWFLFSDAKLQTQMRRAIHNDIQGSILQSGLGDKPFWSGKPIAGMPFQFMGYVYAASNKFTFPLLQNADVEKFLGLFMMAAYGTMIEPMRAIVKGEDPAEIFDSLSEKGFDQWLVDGTLESGVGGHLVELIAMADAMIQPSFLDRYRGRFNRRQFSGILGGPFGGFVQNAVDVAEMYINGKINQGGLKKTSRLIPLPYPVYLEALISRGIKGTNIPEKRGDAEYYSWVNRD